MREKCTRSNTTWHCPQPQISHTVSPQLSQKPVPFSMRQSRSPLPHPSPASYSPAPGSAPSLHQPTPFSPSFLPLILSNQVGSLSQVSKHPKCEADSWQKTFLTSGFFWGSSIPEKRKQHGMMASPCRLPAGDAAALGLPETWVPFSI